MTTVASSAARPIGWPASTSLGQGGRNAQRGQSTVELVVLALVLVPLLLAVPLLGKYIDLMQMAEQASRYVAFEGSVRNTGAGQAAWKSDADLAAEVRRRFFSNSDAQVKTSDTAGNFAAHRNPLWTDPQGHPLLDDFASDVGVTTKAESRSSLSLAWASSKLKLSESNFYTASVTVKPAKVTGFKPFDSIDLSTTRRTVILADAWNAHGTTDVRHKVEAAGVTVYPVGAAKGVIDAFGQVPKIIFDPALKVGEFDWDIVPCDRLGGC